MHQMRQKLYKLKQRNNVETLQEYEDFVCAQSRLQHRRYRSIIARRNRARNRYNLQRPIPPAGPVPINHHGVTVNILNVERPIFQNLKRIANEVSGHIMYSVDLWLYLGGSRVVSYARFRQLVVFFESLRVSSWLQGTAPPATEAASKSISDSMVSYIIRKLIFFLYWLMLY